MIEIANNDLYEVRVDIDKNRLYLTVKGFWKSPAQAPEYIADLKAAAEKIKPGFTILTDLRTMKPPTTEVGQLHVEAQKNLVESGLSKTAEVVGSAILLEMQLKKYAQTSSMSKAEFESVEEAEAWLDSN
jgi:hypothetical protein